MDNLLRAGIARIDITPDIPVMLYGYASRKTPSEGIHDHLYARAVAFEKGGRKLVMISTDLGSYTDTLYSVIKKEYDGESSDLRSLNSSLLPFIRTALR